MTPQYFRFSAPNHEDMYGYGVQAEAEEYVKVLGPMSSVCAVGDTAELSEPGSVFQISDALSAHRDQ